MSKSIWHTGKEIPDEDRYIVVKNKVGLYSVGSEFEYDLDRVEKWAYFDDFLALETELDRTRKALDIAKLILKNLLPDLNGYERLDVEKAITEITALEQIKITMQEQPNDN